MDPKKLDPQQAFDQLIRDDRTVDDVPEALRDVEEGFGQKEEEVNLERSRWVKWMMVVGGVAMIGVFVIGVAVFYGMVIRDSEPVVEINPHQVDVPTLISEAEAKQKIEANLRAFLSAESNENRARYIYSGATEMASLQVYYDERRIRDMPLWKVVRIEPVVAGGGEIWLVVYQDLKRRQHTASFERVGDDYLLHWSAMKAFGEITWEKFILTRPEQPVTMRAYLRPYDGVRPLWAGSDSYDCYIIEDRGGLFSEIAAIAVSADGYDVLKKLPRSGRRPVTLKLVYRATPHSAGEKVLTIDSFLHIRWQKLSTDPQLKE